MSAPILVTGGAGFLGSWLVRRLIDSGETVRVLDLPSARWADLPEDRIESIRGDIRNAGVVARAVAGCRAVVHLAGLPHLWAHPRGLFGQINYRGAVQVLEAAARAGCTRIVHVSSATVWPLPGQTSCRWSDALGPYCRSKLRAERHALGMARQGAPLVIVSPTLPIGPGDFGQTPPTRLLHDFCRGKRREYVDMRLNLIDVRDAAEGMVRVLEVGVPGARYLLGNESLSLLKLFQHLAALTGQPEPHRRVPYYVALLVGALFEGWADVVSRRTPQASLGGVRLARRALPPDPGADLRRLGVTPRTLETTLGDTVNWFREVGW